MHYDIDEHIRAVRNYDFLKENRDTFYQKLSTESVLCHGEYSSNIPLISILITTHGRINELKSALKSALEQKDFEDYEIIIVDNEAVNIEEETATSRYIKSIKSEKVIYYRNTTPASYRMDTGIAKLRTDWVVFLHDDDVLSPWALKILSDTLKKHMNAKWIVGYMERYEYSKWDDTLKEIIASYPHVTGYIKYPPQCYQESHRLSWLGSLINVQSYIQHGGTPAISLESGDSAMGIRFACQEKVVWVKTEYPLYYYKVWKNSGTGTGAQTIEKMLVSDYLFREYILKRFQVKHQWFWKMHTWMKIERTVDYYRNAPYAYKELNAEYMAQKLCIPKCWRSGERVFRAIEYIYALTERRYVHCFTSVDEMENG